MYDPALHGNHNKRPGYRQTVQICRSCGPGERWGGNSAYTASGAKSERGVLWSRSIILTKYPERPSCCSTWKVRLTHPIQSKPGTILAVITARGDSDSTVLRLQCWLCRLNEREKMQWILIIRQDVNPMIFSKCVCVSWHMHTSFTSPRINSTPPFERLVSKVCNDTVKCASEYTSKHLSTKSPKRTCQETA